MAKIDFAFPVDKVHGKISKKHRIGFAHLTATGRNYTVEYGKRSTPASSSEVAHRKKFAAVCAIARDRLIDATFVDQDMVGFSKQTKYKTMWGYVFKQCWDAYEE